MSQIRLPSRSRPWCAGRVRRVAASRHGSSGTWPERSAVHAFQTTDPGRRQEQRGLRHRSWQARVAAWRWLVTNCGLAGRYFIAEKTAEFNQKSWERELEIEMQAHANALHISTGAGDDRIDVGDDVVDHEPRLWIQVPV